MKHKYTTDPNVFYVAFNDTAERDALLARLHPDVKAQAKPGEIDPLVFKVTGALDAEQAAFEDMLRSYGYAVDRTDGRGYYTNSNQCLWLGWQRACRGLTGTLFKMEEKR